MWKKQFAVLLVINMLLTAACSFQKPDSQEICDVSSAPASDISTECRLSDADIAAIIDSNLNIFTQDDSIIYPHNNSNYYIDAHPDAFSQITALGKDALPHLMKIIEDTDIDHLTRSMMAMAAAYAIQPSLYEPFDLSPDGKYALTAAIAAFYPDRSAVSIDYSYDTFYFLDTVSGSVLASLDASYKNPSVIWSPDHRYAAILETAENQPCSSKITVFDSSDHTLQEMPRLAMQNKIHALVPDSSPLYSCDLLSCTWNTDGTLRVTFDMKTGAAYYLKSNPGQYTYDLSRGMITDFTHSIESAPQFGSNLPDEERIKIIDKNLRILTENSDAFYGEQDLIEAHPTAF